MKKKDFLVKKSLAKHLLTFRNKIVKKCCIAILTFAISYIFLCSICWFCAFSLYLLQNLTKRNYEYKNDESKECNGFLYNESSSIGNEIAYLVFFNCCANDGDGAET